jgi:hypothetical protein
MSRTHEALRRAEANFQKRDSQVKYSEPNEQLELAEALETCLLDLGLSEKQISNQDLKQIKINLKQLDQCIANPKISLNIQVNDSETDYTRVILPILIDRKKFLLRRFNDLVIKRKYHNIRVLLNKVTDNSIKTPLEKIINDLYIKDKILEKEYKKLEQLLSTIADKKQKKKDEPHADVHQNQPIEAEKKTPKKSIRIRDSLGIFILGVLLMCLTLYIAIAPLVSISVPSSLNIAFFIILGFFFGLIITRLVRL